MDFNFLKAHIDRWDPMDLLSHAPDDEYDYETAQILNLFLNGKNLGWAIFEVFQKAYGCFSFEKTIADCDEFARQILEEVYGPQS